MEEASLRSKKGAKREKLVKILISPPLFLFLLVFSLTPAPFYVHAAAAEVLEPGTLTQEFNIEGIVFTELEKKSEQDVYKTKEYLRVENIEKRKKEKALEEAGKIAVSFPESKTWETKYSTRKTVTAYNSEVAQCDDTPCITANGFNVCEHGIEDTVAANFLKFGTKIRIPEMFGDRVFIVRDRMNKRYSNRIDVWMINKSDAKQFGVRNLLIEVLE